MGRMLVLLIIFTAAGAPLGALAQAPELTRDEIMRVLWHGPWPPARASHPERAAIALGERLFFDPRISGNGSVLCASCHVPYRGFQDGRPRAFGLEEGERNTPSLFNVGFYRRYGWDGARASLAAQSLRPLLEKKEMNSSAAHVASLVRKLYAADYRSAFARAPGGDDEKLFADAGTALAAFQGTLVSARTPFDDFRDALERGDERAASSYSATARRGLKLFIAQCSTCHAGPLFSDGAMVGKFRVPSLRNVALTAPYMHDGSVPSLEQAVRHTGTIAPGEARELVTFLETLTETAALK